jgi:hypothetical protein
VSDGPQPGDLVQIDGRWVEFSTIKKFAVVTAPFEVVFPVEKESLAAELNFSETNLGTEHHPPPEPITTAWWTAAERWLRDHAGETPEEIETSLLNQSSELRRAVLAVAGGEARPRES